jgi:excisionase family DNA binding protein
MAHVTLGEAARQTGRSKSQISRAIRDGRLSAERSAETASFRIEQSELQRWLDATDVIRATVLDGLAENPATGAEHAALEVQIERFKEAADLLRAQLADKCSQLADALAQRDEWREAFKQQRALPPPQPAPQGWGRWLALTTLLAIVVTAAIVAVTVLAISFALAERPASFGEALVDTVDRLTEPALTGFYGFYGAGAPSRSAHLARTGGGEAREIRMASQSSSSRMFIAW